MHGQQSAAPSQSSQAQHSSQAQAPLTDMPPTPSNFASMFQGLDPSNPYSQYLMMHYYPYMMSAAASAAALAGQSGSMAAPSGGFPGT